MLKDFITHNYVLLVIFFLWILPFFCIAFTKPSHSFDEGHSRHGFPDVKGITATEEIKDTIIDTVVCYDTVTLQGTKPDTSQGESGEWRVLFPMEARDSIHIEDETSYITLFSNLLKENDMQVRWRVYDSSGGIISEKEVFYNIIHDGVTPADITEDSLNICQSSDTVSHTAKSDDETVTWNFLEGSGSVAQINDTLSLVSNLQEDRNVLERVLDNGDCISRDTAIIINNSITAADAGNDSTSCSSSFQLNGNSYQGDETGAWSGTGDIADPSGPKTAVSNVPNGTHEYIWTIEKNNCQSKDTVVIEVNPYKIANAGKDTAICKNSYELQANNPSVGGTGEWSLIEGNGDFDNINAPRTTVSNLAEGLNKLVWTLKSDGCNDSKDTVVITNNKPTTARAGQDTVICSDNLALYGNIPTQGIGVWKWADGTVIDSVKEEGDNPVVSELPSDSSWFYYTIHHEDLCSPSEDSLLVVNNEVSEALVPEDSIICRDSMLLEAEPFNTGTGQWSANSGGPDFKYPDSSSTPVHDIDEGIITFYWEIFKGKCSSVDSMLVDNQTPTHVNAGNDTIICKDTITLYSEIPTQGRGVWYHEGDPVDTITDNNQNPFIPDLSANANIYVMRVRNGICSDYKDTVEVYKLKAHEADAGKDSVICQDSIRLYANDTTDGMGYGQWQTGSFGKATFSDPADHETWVIPDTVQNEFVWTITSKKDGKICQSRDTVIISDQMPSRAKIEADTVEYVKVCNDEVALLNNNPEVGVGEWSWDNSSVNFEKLSDTTASFSDLPRDTTTVYWTITNENYCSGIAFTDSVKIINQLPSEPEILTQDTLNLCIDSATFEAQAPYNDETGQWIIPDTMTKVDSTDSTISVINIPKDTSIIVWQLRKEECRLDDTILVINNMPHYSDMASDSVCADSTLLPGDDQIDSLEYGNWEPVVVDGIDGADSIAQLDNGRYAAIDLALGYNYYEWEITKGQCSLKDTVFVRNDLPSEVVFTDGLEDTVCSDTIELPGNEPVQGNPEWEPISSVEVFSPDKYNSLARLNKGTNTLEYSISTPQCGSTPGHTYNVMNNSPSKAYIGQDTTLCSNEITLQADDIEQGEGRWYYDSLNIEATALGERLQVEDMPVGANIFYYAVSHENCPVSRDTIIVYNNLPSSANIITPDTAVCQYSGLLISAEEPVQGNYQWENGSEGGQITNQNSTTTGFDYLAKDTNTFYWRVTHGNCEANLDSIVIANNETSDADAGSNGSGLCTDSFMLNASQPQAGESGAWSVVSDDQGDITPSEGLYIENIHDPNSMVYDIYPGRKIFLNWVISKNGCTDTSQIYVQNLQPDSIDAGEDFQTCFIEDFIEGSDPEVQVDDAVGTWSAPNESICFTTGEAGDNCTDTKSESNVLVSGMNQPKTYQMIWTVQGASCEPIHDTLEITRQNNLILDTDQITDSVCNANEYQLSQLNIPDTPDAYGVWDSLNTLRSPVSPLVDDSTDPGTRVYNLRPGSETFLRWTVTKGECSGTVDVLLHNYQKPDSAQVNSDIALCEQDTLTLEGNKPVNGQAAWYADTISGSAQYSIDEEMLSISALNLGVSRFIYEIQNGICPVSRDTSDIVNYESVNEIFAGYDDTVCNNVYHLNAYNLPDQDNFSGQWIWDESIADIEHVNNPETEASNLELGIHTFTWKVENGVCVDSAQMNLYVKPELSSPVIQNEDSSLVCNDSVILVANDISDGNRGVWQANSQTEIVYPDSTETLANQLMYGSNTFYWQVSSPGCQILQDSVSIINNNPGTPEINTSQYVTCTDEISLESEIDGYGSGIWHSTTDDISYQPGNTTKNVVVDNLRRGPNEIIFSVSTDSDCAVKSDTIVITNNRPSVPFAGYDDSLCETYSYQVNATVPDTGSGSWIIPDHVFTDNTDTADMQVNNLQAGKNQFVWNVENNGCRLKDTLNVYVYKKPDNAEAGAAQSILANQTRLNANDPETGTGIWQLVRGEGNIADNRAPDTYVYELSAGENIFKWTIYNGVCEPSEDSVAVRVNPFKIPSGFSPNNDGKNDAFVIRGLNNFNSSQLTVYNRWGEVVYTNSNYNNNWRGKNNRGKQLSDDTYFYLLKLSNGKTYNGSVVIKR